MRRFLTRSALALGAVVGVLGVTETPADAASVYIKFDGVDGEASARPALLELQVGVLEPGAAIAFLRLNGREIPVTA